MADTTPTQTIAELVGSSDDFNILLKAVVAAGLDGALAADGADLTVFAPTDAAFVELAEELGFDGDPSDEDAVFGAIADALAALDPNGNPIPLLTDILLYHVSPGAKSFDDVEELDTVPTLLTGATISPDDDTLVDNEPDLDDPSVIAEDIGATNGIVHAIDRVLIPIDIPGPDAAEVAEDANDADSTTVEDLRLEQGDSVALLDDEDDDEYEHDDEVTGTRAFDEDDDDSYDSDYATDDALV